MPGLLAVEAWGLAGYSEVDHLLGVYRSRCWTPRVSAAEGPRWSNHDRDQYGLDGHGDDRVAQSISDWPQRLREVGGSIGVDGGLKPVLAPPF